MCAFCICRVNQKQDWIFVLNHITFIQTCMHLGTLMLGYLVILTQFLQATKSPSSKTVNGPSSTPGASVYHSFLVLRHKINSAMSKYALSLDSLLVPLALLRLMLFGEVFAPFVPQWALTRCYWLAYILVCIHWLLVMHRELHSLTVIKKCYSSMFRIVFRGGIFEYPFNLCLGIVFFLVAALTIFSIIFRASHSAHEWAGQRTVILQIMVIPLLGIHVYAVLLQGIYIQVHVHTRQCDIYS